MEPVASQVERLVPRSWFDGLNDDPLASGRRSMIQRFIPFALVLLSPFSTLHLLRAEWLLGLAVVCAQVVMFVLWLLLRRGGSASPLLTALAIFDNAMVLNALHWQGTVALPWVSVVLVTNYFLVPRKHAHGLSLCLLVAAPLTVGAAEGAAIALRLAAASLFLLILLNVVLSALAQAEQRLIGLAEIDPLTGAGNRRRFERLASNLAPRGDGHRTPNCLLAIDIDHFKSINDRFGHPVGDEVLRCVAQRIRYRLRESDHLFRTGGEEFAVILARTGLGQACAVAEDIRQLFADREVAHGVRITVSIGICAYGAGTALESWVKAADDALYAAKREGRNRVVVHGGEAVSSAAASVP